MDPDRNPLDLETRVIEVEARTCRLARIAVGKHAREQGLVATILNIRLIEKIDEGMKKYRAECAIRKRIYPS